MRFKTLAFVAILSISGIAFGQITLNRDGQLDRQFGTNGTTIVDPASGPPNFWGLGDLVLLPDGKVLIMYEVVLSGNTTAISLFRTLDSGQPDTSFGVNGKVVVSDWPQFIPRAAAVQPDGKIVVGGMSINGNDFMIVRLTANGQPDTAFATNGIFTKDFSQPGGSSIDSVYSLIVPPDGKIIATGVSIRTIPSQTGDGTASIVRLNSNGSPDTSFALGGAVCVPVADYPPAGQTPNDRSVRAILQSDGKLVVATAQGRYSPPESTNYVRHHTILRFLSDGSLDPGFGQAGIADFQDPNGEIMGFHSYPDGKMLLTSLTTLERFNSDGSPDSSYFS
jgi:uncharacterized delta-60 repeat protein